MAKSQQLNLQLVLISLLLFVLITNNEAAASNKYFVNRLEFLELLRNNKFDELDNRLDELQEKYKKGELSDRYYSFAVSSFSNSDPKLLPKLNEWIKAKPDSYSAYLARAGYYVNLGYESRGTGFASDTREQQFKKMNDYFSKSADDIRSALKLEPKLTSAYASMINLLTAYGDSQELTDTFNASMKLDPHSYSVFAAYSETLNPKWGGSLESINEFISLTQKSGKTDNDTKKFEGLYDYILADMARLKKNYKKSNLHLKKAISYGDFWEYYYLQARNHYSLEQYDKALQDLNKANALSPQNTRVLNRRGWIYYLKRNYQKAFDDFDMVVKLDRYHSDALRGRGLIYQKRQLKYNALSDFSDALIYGKYSARTWANRANLQANQFKNLRAAADDYRRAVELKPKNTEYWYWYLVQLVYLDDCDVINAINNYQQLCAAKRSCYAKQDEWVQQHKSHIIKLGMCRNK